MLSAGDVSRPDRITWFAKIIPVIKYFCFPPNHVLCPIFFFRKKGSRNLQEVEVDMSHFDKEHFSVEPEYTYPVYPPDNDSDDDSVRRDMYVVNGYWISAGYLLSGLETSSLTDQITRAETLCNCCRTCPTRKADEVGIRVSRFDMNVSTRNYGNSIYNISDFCCKQLH